MTCVLIKTERRSIGRCSGGFFCLLLVATLRHYTSYGAMTERGLMPPSFGANRSLFFSNKRGTSFSNKRGTLFSNKRGTTAYNTGILVYGIRWRIDRILVRIRNKKGGARFFFGHSGKQNGVFGCFFVFFVFFAFATLGRCWLLCISRSRRYWYVERTGNISVCTGTVCTSS